MRKNKLLLLSVFASAFLLVIIPSCDKEEQNSGLMVEMTFKAYMEEQDKETKTILSGDDNDSKRPVFWVPNDSIGVSTGSGVSMFVYKGRQTTATAEFSGTVAHSSRYYSFFPYSSEASIESEQLSCILPDVQKYVTNSFDTLSFSMVAVSTTPELHFKNLCGILKLNLFGDSNVKSIVFSAKDTSDCKMKVSGAATVSFSYEDEPKLEMSSSAQDSVILDCGSGVQLNTTEATPFYLVLPPATYHNFTLTITTDKGTIVKNSSSLVINRSRIRPTSNLKIKTITEPTVSTTEASSVTYTTAKAGGNVTSDGGPLSQKEEYAGVPLRTRQ